MPRFEVSMKEARKNFNFGFYGASVAAYQKALEELTQEICKTSNNPLRNKLVELRNTIQSELSGIEKMLSAEDDLAAKFGDVLDEEAKLDSPPADPTASTPAATSTSTATTMAATRFGGVANANDTTAVFAAPTKRPAQSSMHLSRKPITRKPDRNTRPYVQRKDAKLTTATHNYNNNGVKTSSSIGGGVLDVSTASSVNKCDTTTTSTTASGSSESEKVFDSCGYESELVALVQNAMIHPSAQGGIRWTDIAGLESAKDLLAEAIVLPMEYPELFKGIRRPWRGICMFGPPGTGKTLLAKAVASECKSTFFSVSSALLASKFRGESEKLVRLLFEMARFHSPAIIFIDEIDSICSSRGTNSEHEASRRVKSELLIQMDGCSSDADKTVLVLAATNFPWDLDEALRRRLEKRIYIPLPDCSARVGLMQNALKEVQLADDVDLNVIADRLDGYSGSDISSICRDAAMGPMRECLRRVDPNMDSRRRALESQPDLTIHARHFDLSIAQIMPSVAQETLARYAEWMREFGSK